MGEWLGTCGISNLPIHEDEPVRALVLEGNHCALYTKPGDRRSWGGGYTQVDEIFKPITPPLKGTYDGYGGVVFEKSKVFNVVNNHFKATLNKGTFNKNHAENVLNLIECVKDFRNNIVPAGLWLVKEDIFNVIVDNYPAAILLDIKNTIEDNLNMVAEFSYFTNKTNFLPDFYHEIPKFLYSWSTSSIRKGNSIVELVQSLTELFALRYALCNLRIGFMPQPGAGSQNEDTSFHKVIAAHVVKNY